MWVRRAPHSLTICSPKSMVAHFFCVLRTRTKSEAKKNLKTIYYTDSHGSVFHTMARLSASRKGPSFTKHTWSVLSPPAPHTRQKKIKIKPEKSFVSKTQTRQSHFMTSFAAIFHLILPNLVILWSRKTKRPLSIIWRLWWMTTRWASRT